MYFAAEPVDVQPCVITSNGPPIVQVLVLMYWSAGFYSEGAEIRRFLKPGCRTVDDDPHTAASASWAYPPRLNSNGGVS